MSARRAATVAACAAAAAVALPSASAASAAASSATASPLEAPHLAPPPAGAPTHLPAPLEGLVLKQAHVIFRHGARAPLSTKHGNGEANWSVCGEAYDAVRVQVLRLDGAPKPASAADARQRATLLPGGCHLGELTKVGQLQARALGGALRSRYGGLLPPHAHSAAACAPALAVRSSNVQRTVATAQGVLTGLFPEEAAEAASSVQGHTSKQKGAHAQSSRDAVHSSDSASGTADPAVIRVADDADEWLFPNFEACARLRWLWRQRAARGGAPPGADADAWRRPFDRQLASLAAALAGRGDDVAALAQPWGVVELMDACTARAAHGLAPLAPALTPRHVDELRDVAAAVVAGVFTGGTGAGAAESEEGLRLSVGRLLADVTSGLDAAAQRRAPLRLALYGAHDTTVLPLLLAMRAAAGPKGGKQQAEAALTWPPFASHVSFELWGPPESEASVSAASASGSEPSGAGATSSSASGPPAADPGAEGAHFVRVLYNFEALPLACARGAKHGACRLADFKALLAPLLPRDFGEECAQAPTGMPPRAQGTHAAEA